MSYKLWDILTDEYKGNHDSFYGHYEDLNQFNKLDYTDMYNIQLQQFVDQLKNVNNFEDINKFLTELRGFPIPENVNQLQVEVGEEAKNYTYIRILEILNSGLWSSENSIRRNHLENNGWKLNKEVLSKEIEENLAELDTLLSAINYSRDRIDGIKNSLKNAINNRTNKKTWTHGGYYQVGGKGYRTWAQLKAQEMEKIVEQIINENNFFKALQTGQYTVDGLQLIEDEFLFKKDQSFEGGITFKIDGQKKTVYDLNQLLDLAGGFNETHSISLDNSMYEKLQELKAAAVQVKSGASLQELINKNDRNSISISALSQTEKNYAEMLFRDLKKGIDPSQTEIMYAFGNYLLSVSCGLTNIAKNEIYFTRDGFITAAEWMAKYRQMLKFLNPTSFFISDQTLGVPRRYGFFAVDN